MAISGFLFVSWRLFQLIILIPVVGMLGWFVAQYNNANLLTPTYVLVLFIVSVLALAWVFFTLIAYWRARHDAMFVALVDLGFVGAFIAGVYYLRGIAGADCSNSRASFSNGVYISISTNKECAMLKASFALSIIAILTFFTTFLIALLVHHNHKNDDEIIVKRTYRSTHHSGHRSRSRDHRSSRDHAYERPSSQRRSHRSSSRSRRAYV